MEVFGSVITAIELIHKAKSSLERAKRVGKTIKSLRFTLNRLMELEDDVDPDRDQDLLTEIKDLVDEAMELIQENRNPRRQALAFFWTATVDADVQRINTSLSIIYASLSRRIDRTGRGSVATVDLPQTIAPADTSLLVDEVDLSPRPSPRRVSTARLETPGGATTFSVPCTLCANTASIWLRPLLTIPDR
jgi:uncharacterized membrane protein